MSRNIELQPSFEDREDFKSVSRGFIDSLKPCIIEAISGGTAWNTEDYKFLEQDQCPPTVNPKLWRQSQLSLTQGLFEVAPGIYQLRGLDLSNMTVVEGKTGIIIIDPLTSDECATAALKLYQQHRGKRPVTAMIYSHSHADHFGGAGGILETAQQTPSSIPIIAPEFFMEEATNENILVGPAMARRAVYMYGKTLPVSPIGQVGCGLGLRVSIGKLSLIAPNTTIRETGQTLELDGIKITFQMVPNTEAPAEMNMYFPSHRALLVAECATHCLHNIITLRGALVRDAKAWARYLDETLVLYGEGSDVLFSSHHWPTWGTQNLSKLLSEQRDLYTYLHDQTIRLMNNGLNGTEIAEELRLPPSLQTAWHVQGFYGSVSHNVKGIYQRYMTWFDGNPANLWKHTPREEAKRFVECMGGVDQVITKADLYVQNKDLRFAATLLDYVVQVDPEHTAGRQALASVYEMLGFGAENATWRNFYLCAALDLRSPKAEPKKLAMKTMFGLDSAISQWLDCLSVALDGEVAASHRYTFAWKVTDEGSLHRINVSNGAMTTRVVTSSSAVEDVGFTLTASKKELHRCLSGDIEAAEKFGQGDLAAWSKFLHACGILHPLVESNNL